MEAILAFIMDESNPNVFWLLAAGFFGVWCGIIYRRTRYILAVERAKREYEDLLRAEAESGGQFSSDDQEMDRDGSEASVQGDPREDSGSDAGI